MILINTNNLFFLIIFVTICSCQEGPSIISITQEQVADIGGSVELNCTTSNADGISIIWNKKFRDRPNDNIVLTFNTVLAIQDPRFEISHNNVTHTSTLKIKNIQPLDSGIYECQIGVSLNEKKTLQVDLFVRKPPIINENTSSLIVTSPEGQTVKLTCMAEGFPHPEITWKRENLALLPGGGNTFSGNVLRILNVRREDRGVYHCIASNGVGNPDSKIINLEIEFAPIISVPRPKTAQAQFYDIDLNCNVEAYPSPSIAWFKNGQQLNHNDNYRISHVAHGNDMTVSSLRVKAIGSSDYGDYYCKATNKIGHLEARLNLYESVIQVNL